MNISDTVSRKFVDSVDVQDYEILTDSGWRSDGNTAGEYLQRYAGADKTVQAVLHGGRGAVFQYKYYHGYSGKPGARRYTAGSGTGGY